MAYARKRYGRNSGGLVMGRPMFPMNMPRPFGEYVAVGDAETAANPFTASFGFLGDGDSVGVQLNDKEFAIRDSLTSPNVKTVAAVALTYHGYKRNGSIFWALAWGLLGKTIPLAAVPIALAQGFGKKKEGC